MTPYRLPIQNMPPPPKFGTAGTNFWSFCTSKSFRMLELGSKGWAGPHLSRSWIRALRCVHLQFRSKVCVQQW